MRIGRATPLLAAFALAALLLSPLSLDAQEASVDTAAFLAAALDHGVPYAGKALLASGIAAYEIVDPPTGRPVHARRPPRDHWPPALLGDVAERAERAVAVCPGDCEPEQKDAMTIRLGPPEDVGEGRHRVVVEVAGRREIGQYGVVLEDRPEGPRLIERRVLVVSISARVAGGQSDPAAGMLAAALGAVIRQEGFPGAVRIELDQPGYRIDERDVWRRAPDEGRWPAGFLGSVAELTYAGGRRIEVCDPSCPPSAPGDVRFALGQPRLLDDGRHRIAVLAIARYSSGSVHTGHEAMYQVLVETMEDGFHAQADMEYEALYGRP